MHRQPAVAGYFYQGAPARLSEQVRGYIEKDSMKSRAIGILSPHAGLIYSGIVAGAVANEATKAISGKPLYMLNT